MAEETVVDSKETKVPEGATDEKVVTKVEDTKLEGEEDKGEEGTEDKGEDHEEPKKDSRLNRRFKDLTTKIRTKEADVRTWSETLAEVTGEAPPVRSDFKTPEEFKDAVDDYRDKVRSHKTNLDKAQKDLGKANAEYTSELVSAWDTKVEVATKDLPDYKKVVAASKVPFSSEVLTAIMASSKGPQIAYYLAKNEDVAYDILDLPANEQLLEIGKLESKVQSPRKAVGEKTKTKEPPNEPPSKQIKAEKATTKKAPGDMSLEEFQKWRKEGGGK